MNGSRDVPPHGGRPHPVQKNSKRERCSADMSSATISQNHDTHRVFASNPPSYRATRRSASTSTTGSPPTSSDSSRGVNKCNAGPPQTPWNPAANAANDARTATSSACFTYKSTNSRMFLRVTGTRDPFGFISIDRTAPERASTYSYTKSRDTASSTSSSSSSPPSPRISSIASRPLPRLGESSRRSASVGESPNRRLYAT
eukprot:31494-Pelagococcus_subviridis.AAC.33